MAVAMAAATMRPGTSGGIAGQAALARPRSVSRRRRGSFRRSMRAAVLAAGVAVPLLVGLLAADAGTAASAAPTASAPTASAPTASAPTASAPTAPAASASTLTVPASTGPAGPGWPSPVPSAPIPAGTDAPSPAPPGPAGDPLDPGGGENDPGFFDVGGKIRKAINDWFRNLVTSAASSLLDALGRTVLATPDPETNPRIRDLWTTTVIIANTCYGLLVVIGGLIGMGYETVQTRTAVKDILPRLVVGFVAANVSLGLVGQAVRFTNALCQAFTGQGVRPGEGVTWSKLVIVPVAGDGIFLVLLCLVAVVLAAVLIGTCILRAAIIVLLAVSGPLALSCHALPQTEGVANLWWRALAGSLGVQVAQAFTLVTAVRVFLVSDGTAAAGLTVSGRLINVLLAICLLWVCIRIPTWTRHMIFTSGGRRSLVGTVVRTLILAKTLGLARTGLSRLGRSGAAGPTAGRAAAGGPGRGPAGGRGPGGGLGGPAGGPRGPRGPGGGPRRGPGGGGGPSGPAGSRPRGPHPRGPRDGPGGGPGSRPGGARRPRPQPGAPAGTRPARPGADPGGTRTNAPTAPAAPTAPGRADRSGRRPGDIGWAAPAPTRLSTPATRGRASSAGGAGGSGGRRAAQRIQPPGSPATALRLPPTTGPAGTVPRTPKPTWGALPGRISAPGSTAGASVQRPPTRSTTPRSTVSRVGPRQSRPRAEGVWSSPAPSAVARPRIPPPARGPDRGGPPPAPGRRAVPVPPVDRRAELARARRRAEDPIAATPTAPRALPPAGRPTDAAPVRPARAAGPSATTSTVPRAAMSTARPAVPAAEGHSSTAPVSPPPRPPATSGPATSGTATSCSATAGPARRPARRAVTPRVTRLAASRPTLPSPADGLDPRTGRGARPPGRPDEQRSDQR